MSNLSGLCVEIIAPEKKLYKGKTGYPVEAELSAVKANAKDYDVLIVPGGWAPDRLRRYETVNNFVRECSEKDKQVLQICPDRLGEPYPLLDI